MGHFVQLGQQTPATEALIGGFGWSKGPGGVWRHTSQDTGYWTAGGEFVNATQQKIWNPTTGVLRPLPQPTAPPPPPPPPPLPTHTPPTPPSTAGGLLDILTAQWIEGIPNWVLFAAGGWLFWKPK